MRSEFANVRDKIIRAEPAMNCRQVQRALETVWEQRPAREEYDGDGDLSAEQQARFEHDAETFESEFYAVLKDTWAASRCRKDRLSRFTEDPETITPVYATEDEVLEFSGAHRFPGGEYFYIHRWAELESPLRGAHPFRHQR